MDYETAKKTLVLFPTLNCIGKWTCEMRLDMI